MLIGALVIITIAAYLFYFQFPHQEEIELLEEEIQDQESELNIAMVRAQQLPNLEAELEELEFERARLLEDELSVSDLLVQVSEISENNNVEVLGFSPRQRDEYIELDFSLHGDYSDICDVFSDLVENIERLELVSLDIFDSGNDGLVNVEFHGVYHRLGI